MIIHCLSRLPSRLVIRTALSHLLLGVVVVGFGFSQQRLLGVNEFRTSSSQTNIISIATISAQIQEQIVVAHCLAQAIHLLNDPSVPNHLDSSVHYPHIETIDVVKVTSANGIRDGPTFLIA